MASTKSELAKAQTSFQPTNALLLIRLCAPILLATVAHHPVFKRETAIAKERGRDDSMESSSQDRGCIVELPWSRGNHGPRRLMRKAGRLDSRGRAAMQVRQEEALPGSGLVFGVGGW